MLEKARHRPPWPAALLLPLALPCLAGEATYDVRWPAGWEVRTQAAPAPMEKAPGARIRALKVKDGHVVAAIELTHFPRSDGGKASLVEEFGGVVSGIRSGYERAGLTATVSEPSNARLGSLAARHAEVSASTRGATMKQWISMAFGRETVYTFTYTGSAESYAAYQPDFLAALASLRLR